MHIWWVLPSLHAVCMQSNHFPGVVVIVVVFVGGSGVILAAKRAKEHQTVHVSMKIHATITPGKLQVSGLVTLHWFTIRHCPHGPAIFCKIHVLPIFVFHKLMVPGSMRHAVHNLVDNSYVPQNNSGTTTPPKMWDGMSGVWKKLICAQGGRLGCHEKEGSVGYRKQTSLTGPISGPNLAPFLSLFREVKLVCTLRVYPGNAQISVEHPCMHAKHTKYA